MKNANPVGVAFMDGGTKMFVVRDAGDDVNEYMLSAAFDVSTATFVDTFAASLHEINPQNMAFSSDGIKMFMMGANSSVNEYALSTAFDFSTATFVNSFYISSHNISTQTESDNTSTNTVTEKLLEDITFQCDHCHTVQMPNPNTATLEEYGLAIKLRHECRNCGGIHAEYILQQPKNSSNNTEPTDEMILHASCNILKRAEDQRKKHEQISEYFEGVVNAMLNEGYNLCTHCDGGVLEPNTLQCNKCHRTADVSR